MEIDYKEGQEFIQSPEKTYLYPLNTFCSVSFDGIHVHSYKGNLTVWHDIAIHTLKMMPPPGVGSRGILEAETNRKTFNSESVHRVRCPTL